MLKDLYPGKSIRAPFQQWASWYPGVDRISNQGVEPTRPCGTTNGGTAFCKFGQTKFVATELVTIVFRDAKSAASARPPFAIAGLDDFYMPVVSAFQRLHSQKSFTPD